MIKLTGFVKRGPIGVDIGGRWVKAIQLSQSSRGWRVEATAAFARVTTNGPITRTEARRLGDVLRRRSFTGNQVILAVPDDKLIVGTMELPARSAGISLDAVARTEFARAYKCEPGSFEMGYWDMPAPARAARTTNVMGVACPHAEAEAVVDLFASVDLEVVGLDARPCAMARACQPAAADAAGIVLLLEVGWNSMSLVVLNRGVVVYERAVVEAGLKNLHTELIGALKVTSEVADCILTAPNLFSDEPEAVAPQPVDTALPIPPEVMGEVRGIAASHFDTASREVMASVSYTSHQYPDSPVTRLLLLGGGALMPGIAEHLQNLLGFECRVVTPLASASCAPAVARDCTASLTTAAGLAALHEW